MKIRNREKGLTFIEMLLATAMSVIISIAVYMMISNGLKVWARVNHEIPEMNVSLFFDRLETELNNCIFFKNIEFTGGTNILSFPILIPQSLRGSEDVDLLGRLTYFFDANETAVKREFAGYPELFTSDITPQKFKSRYVLDNVHSIFFQYYYYDYKRKTFFWSDVWPLKEQKEQKKKYPLAVKVVLEIDNKGIFTNYSKTIPLLIGDMLYSE